MWLARRASTKPIDPGMLDNLVGGGITSVFRCRHFGERGLGGSRHPRRARAPRHPRRHGQVLREVPEGVQCELVDSYDLELPQTSRRRTRTAKFRSSSYPLCHFFERETQNLTYEAAIVARDYLSRSRAP